MPEVTAPLRKDAALNRERLLAAASELFATRGLNVTLNDIAHHAGVGVGTAYRRFPNKEAIIDALFEQRMQEVADVAQQALDDPDAWNGLLTFLERALHMRHGDRGLNEIMNNRVLGDERVSQVRDRIAPIITKLVTKAKKQAVVRPDFDQSDMIFIQLGLSAIIDATRELSPNLYRRYLTMFLDGIRTDRESFTRLPVKPLTADETHRAMTRQRRNT
ncbi:MAG TPA: helix-turn-helix domain-containing protein [Jatrophihabitans sp.]|nr:helix-turn-helix domain-containing protein [Jatrophihabitans sp.]